MARSDHLRARAARSGTDPAGTALDRPVHVHPGVHTDVRASEDIAVGWAWRTPLVGATLAVVVVTTGVADAASSSPSPAPASSTSPSPGPNAAQLQSQAQREAGVLAAE